jgi:hypothetical protein
VRRAPDCGTHETRPTVHRVAVSSLRSAAGSLLDADAVDADLGALAYALVCLIVDRTGRGSGEPEGQLELMARYVAGADRTVRLSPGDMNVRVQFPDRPARLC